MHRTRWSGILACFLLAAVLTWVGLDLLLRHRGWVPSLTVWGAAVGLVMGAVVLVAGFAVKRLRQGRDTWMTLTGAATTAAAAQASAIVGALIAGIYAGELALSFTAPDSPAMTSLMWSAAVCLLASAIWCGVGLLVEHWCAISADDDDDPDHGGGHSGAGLSHGATASVAEPASRPRSD